MTLWVAASKLLKIVCYVQNFNVLSIPTLIRQLNNPDGQRVSNLESYVENSPRLLFIILGGFCPQSWKILSFKATEMMDLNTKC